uniref:Uncharacterized protein n=1 Tax=Anguilla anguilla TaxID=7936 RepID=A0A0E9TZ41_ANGAN
MLRVGQPHKMTGINIYHRLFSETTQIFFLQEMAQISNTSSKPNIFCDHG